MVKLLMTEFRKNKRSKSIYLSIAIILAYLVLVAIYTVEATGLFDDFIYLYKFALGYMIYLILPMILLTYVTATFSDEYKNDTFKYIWTIPVSRGEMFLSKVLYVLCMAVIFMTVVFGVIISVAFFSRFRTSIDLHLTMRFFTLCMTGAVLVTLAILPISIISIITKGNNVVANLIGSVYVLASFFLMNILQGISPLSSVSHILWYNNFEGVLNNQNVIVMFTDLLLFFGVYVCCALKTLGNQDL